jgi:hypothetical protein
VPTLRPFRALRLTCPRLTSPRCCAAADVISPAQQALLAQHPYNVVRIELPADLATPRTSTIARLGDAGSLAA